MNNKKAAKYKYLDLIILLDVVMMVVVNVISGKIVQIGFFTLSAASLCIPATYIFGDLLTEVYGYRQARRATWILIFSSILTAIIFQLVVFLPPAPGFKGNDSYTFVLGQVPRVVIGAWVALFVGQFVNDFVLARMKIITKGRYLWSRTIGSTIFGQVADTALFYTVALYNLIPMELFIKSILSAWFLKVLIEVVMTPVTYIVINRLKRTENEDYFDKNTNFSPIVIELNQK